MYKYNWVWKKARPGGFVSAKLKPLKSTEDICVFSNGTTANCSSKNIPYYPQNLVKIDKPWKRPQKYKGVEGVNFSRPSHILDRTLEYTNYPKNILEFNNPNKNVLHPTEKPLALCEYFIKTYTNEGDLVLDNCAGSFTTAVACDNLNRNWICMEKELNYCQIGLKRINENREKLEKEFGVIL